MFKVYLYSIIFLFVNNTFSQVPILFYDFEKNTSRNTFENEVEQTINSGSGPIERMGSGVIISKSGFEGRGRALGGDNWQMVTADPGVNATEYYQFSVNTKGFKGITVRFRENAPYSSSPGNLGYNISSDGIKFKNAGGNLTAVGNTNWNEAYKELYNFPEVNNNANVVIRIYVYKGLNTNSTSTGFMMIDNLIITADTIISDAGEISLLDETNFNESYYSDAIGDINYKWKKSLVINGPGTTVTLVSPVNLSQKVCVNNGSKLRCSDYPLWGTCSFTLDEGASIYIGSSAGIISGPDSIGNICVKGSRIYNPGAGYYYNGSTSQVTGNGLPSSVNVLGILNNNGVSLSHSVEINDTIKFLSGNLIVGDNDLIINDTAVVAGGSSGSYVVTDNSGEMIYNKMIQNTDVKFPVGTINSYNPAILNYTGITDTFKVKVKGVIDFALTNPDKMINCQWDITENNIGGSNATIKLGWVQGQEAPGFNINSDVMIGRWNGENWDQAQAFISGSGTSVDPYIASGSGFTDLSYFSLGNDGALPVELTYFGCMAQGRDLCLTWKTSTEKNSNNFDIERKTLKSNRWENRGSIKANFMSNSSKDYFFTESDLEPGKYLYRLKMNDNDGSFQYSNIVEADINVPGCYRLMQNYPNPFNPSTKICYELPAEAHVLLEVFGVKGEKVASLVNDNKKAGFYEVEFVPSGTKVNLSSGIYFYRMSAIIQNGHQISMVKKMLYIK